jgi:hypothetical protein
MRPVVWTLGANLDPRPAVPQESATLRAVREDLDHDPVPVTTVDGTHELGDPTVGPPRVPGLDNDLIVYDVTDLRRRVPRC